MNNPINFIKNLLANANPQTIPMKMIGNSNPVLGNLAQMAEKGDEKGIENFARNLFKEKGKDFDKEFSDFMNNFKLKK